MKMGWTFQEILNSKEFTREEKRSIIFSYIREYKVGKLIFDCINDEIVNIKRL